MKRDCTEMDQTPNVAEAQSSSNTAAGCSIDQDKESLLSKKKKAPPIPERPKQGSTVKRRQLSVKGLPPPNEHLKLVKPDCVRVTWQHLKGITDVQEFTVRWKSESDGNEESLEVQVEKITIKDLMADEKYEFNVEYKSKDKTHCLATEIINTGVPVPEEVKVDSVTDTFVNLSWSLSNKMREKPHKFLIYYGSQASDDNEAIYTESYTTDITGLTPGTQYTVWIYTVLQNRKKSEAAKVYFITEAAGKGKIKPSLPDSKQTRGWKFYTVAPKKASDIVQQISHWLTERHMTKTHSVEECDFILAVCPVVSRLGTDVEAILKSIPVNHPAILAVVHNTFKPDYVVPDSKKFVSRSDMLLVDLLFDEDQGFLQCVRNNSAFDTIMKWIQSKIKA